jgi:hypothetical protein
MSRNIYHYDVDVVENMYDCVYRIPDDVSFYSIYLVCYAAVI